MVKCKLCGKEVKNTQALRGHMTFVHGQTGSSAILSAPATNQQRLSELEQLLGITRQNTEQATEQPVSRLRARLGLTENTTESITEQLSKIKRKLDKLESITGVREPSSLDSLLGTDKPVTEQLEQHTRQLTELSKEVNEITEQLKLASSNTELSELEANITRVTDKVSELKDSHNELVRVVNNNAELVKKGFEFLNDRTAFIIQVFDAHTHSDKTKGVLLPSKDASDKFNEILAGADRHRGKLPSIESELSVEKPGDPENWELMTAISAFIGKKVYKKKK